MAGNRAPAAGWGQIPARWEVKGGEELAYGHQELEAHRLACLGGEGTAEGGLPAWRPKGGGGRYWEQCSGEGETLASGKPASGGPGAAIYREEKGREGRMAGRHGGGSGEQHRRLGQAAVGAWRHGNGRETKG
jgi:hypothetical protein